MTTSLTQEDIHFLRLAGLLLRVAPRAVRRQFDYEFNPGQLQQFLSKNRPKIEDLYKKRVITVAQYHLLYTKDSPGISSDMLDVSLMACLLRHFTDLDIQDKLPLETIHTTDADISRIKIYRNYIVHSECGIITENRFSEIWNCVVEAILRLVPDLQSEIDVMMISPLTNDRDITQLMKEIDEANQNLRTVNQKLKTLERENMNEREIHKRTLQEWKKIDTKYISTSGTTCILQSLAQNRNVIVTGSPGCGKSVAAHHVALQFEKEGYEIIPCDDFSEIKRHFTIGELQVFVIDDICGKFAVNQHKADKWEQDDDNLNKLLRSSEEKDHISSKADAKFIITCRENIYRHKAFPKLAFIKNNKCYKNEVILGGIKELVKAICRDSELESVISLVAIQKCLERLKGIYITESDDFYTAIHDKMFDIISAAIAPSIMNCLIEHVDIAFIAHRIQLYSCRHGSLPSEFIFQRRYVDFVEYFTVKCQRHLDVKDKQGRSSFYVACENGHIETVKYLMKFHYDIDMIDAKNARKTTALSATCLNGHTEVAKLLLENHADINQTNKLKQSAVHFACSNGNAKLVQQLLYSQYDVDTTIKDYWGKLRYMKTNSENITKQKIDVAKELKNLHTTGSGRTVIHAACSQGHTEVLNLLIDIGMSVNDTTNYGVTPLYLACKNGHIVTVKFLLDLKDKTLISCVKRTIKDKQEQSVLHAACYSGHTEIVKLLIDDGMNVNETTSSGITPLCLACTNGHIVTVKLLLALKDKSLVSSVKRTIKDKRGSPFYMQLLISDILK
ncbi:unnamed protein product [Mytilus edulis]|uniref:DZIP3-like HEPN domain-containing protein n=1 Tax=Mytilus edulis TaxID=6550 RepID=A0A8S3TDC1_MYTED|nr:unnamed protein product [Mytilus edulis]